MILAITPRGAWLGVGREVVVAATEQGLVERFRTIHAAVADDVPDSGKDGRPQRAAALCPVTEATLLAPCTPRRVISVGANYADRCRENGLAVPTAPALDDSFDIPGEGTVVGPQAPVRLPPCEGHAEYGGELGVVIGRACHQVPPEHVAEHVLGYTCLNNAWARSSPSSPGTSGSSPATSS